MQLLRVQRLRRQRLVRPHHPGAPQHGQRQAARLPGRHPAAGCARCKLQLSCTCGLVPAGPPRFTKTCTSNLLSLKNAVQPAVPCTSRPAVPPHVHPLAATLIALVPCIACVHCSSLPACRALGTGTAAGIEAGSMPCTNCHAVRPFTAACALGFSLQIHSTLEIMKGSKAERRWMDVSAARQAALLHRDVQPGHQRWQPAASPDVWNDGVPLRRISRPKLGLVPVLYNRRQQVEIKPAATASCPRERQAGCARLAACGGCSPEVVPPAAWRQVGKAEERKGGCMGAQRGRQQPMSSQGVVPCQPSSAMPPPSCTCTRMGPGCRAPAGRLG